MADESISIEITDKVSSSISTKIQKIATDSRAAHDYVERLKTSLAGLNSNAMTAITRSFSTAVSEINKTTIASQRLATAQRQTATAAQKLATEEQRTAVQLANAAAASDRAALASLRLSQANVKATQSAASVGTSIGSLVGRLATLAAGFISIKAVIGAADEYQALTNKLQIVADSTEQVAELQERLFDISNRTRSSIDATATAFTRFDNALIGLGKSQEESLRLTETINKLFVIGGASAQEQAGAMIQLSQAFNSGVLQGEEFRSIAENMPKAVRTAIAETLKINESALKKAASDGKITADVLFESFKRLDEFADSKFAKTIPTISQSLVVFKNIFVEAVGEMDKSLGVVEAIVKFLGDLSSIVKEAGAAFNEFGKEQSESSLASNLLNGALNVLLKTFQVIAVISSDVIFVFQGVGREIGAIIAQIGALASLDLNAFNAISEAVKEDGIRARKELDAFQARIMAIGLPQAGAPQAEVAKGGGAASTLRGSGKRTIAPVVDNKALKAIENRALQLDKVNRALGEELLQLQRLGPEYAISNRMLEIENDLLDKKIKLLPKEREEITKKLQAIQDQKASNALASINQELDQQSAIYAKIGPQQEIAQQMQQITNGLYSQSIVLTNEQNVALEKRLLLLQQESDLSRARNELFSQFEQPRKDFTTKITAVGEMKNAGDKSQATADLLGGAGVDPSRLQIGMDAQLAAYQETYNRIDQMRQAELISESDFSAAKMQIWAAEQKTRLQSTDQFFGTLAELSTSGNEELASIGKAAAIAQATINGYLAVTNALAVQPYYVGVALAAAAGVTAAANVAKIAGVKGFSQGGYTGNMGVNEVAGAVHGREFVMNAAATSAIGVDTLSRMQSTGQVPSEGAGAAVSITIKNEIPNAQYDVQQIDANTVEIIARRVVDERTDQVTAGNLSNPSSKTSRSLTRNTQTARKV